MWLKKAIIGLCLVAVCFLRLAKLDQIPAGATVDEVNFGYIAYSLAQTGKDEHGVSWPLIFEAYGDQKLPGQVYLILPLVARWGLNLWTTRLPSALMSCALVVMIYYLVRSWGAGPKTALLSSILWALAPAPFILGRGAWESNLAMGCLVLGLIGLGQISLTKPERQKIPWSAVVLWSIGFAGAWYFYVPYRLISAVVCLVMLAVAWRDPAWREKKRVIGLSLVLSAVLILPLVIGTKVNSNLARLSQVGSGQLAGLTLEINEKRTFCALQGRIPRAWCDLVFNKLTLGSKSLINGWWSALGIDFMGLAGENEPMYQVSGFGQVPLVVYLGAVAGLIPCVVTLVRGKGERRTLAGLLLVLLLASVTPAILMGNAQKVRLSAVFPVIFLLFSWGSEYLLGWYQQNVTTLATRRVFLVLACLVSVATVADGVSFLTTYYGYHYFKNDWQTLGHVARIDETVERQQPQTVYYHVNYPDVLMFLAFDTKMDPRYFQENIVWGQREPTGWRHAVCLGGRYFQSEQSVKSLACSSEASSGGGLTLFVEQDGELIDEIDRYLVSIEDKTPAELALAKSLPRAWPIRSVNEANLLAYIVDLDWYRDTFCSPVLETK